MNSIVKCFRLITPWGGFYIRQTGTYSLSFVGSKYADFHSCNSTTKIDEEDEPSFRTLLLKRLQKAHRSVAVEVPSQKALFRASRFIEESANAKELLHFTSKSGKEFIIAEFQDAGQAQRFLSTARSVVRNDEVPTFSRILKYSNTNCNEDNFKEVSSSKINVGMLQNSETKDKTFGSITEVVENVYEEEKLTELQISLRFLVCRQISDAFHGLFRHCEVLPFGSSVNGLGNHASDLDAVLVLYGKKKHEDCGLYFQTKELQDVRYEDKIIHTIGNVLNTFVAGVTHVDPVYRARVPLAKFYHEPFELNCDLSLSNVSGLEMSEFLYDCGQMDSRVRPLAFAIKKWAKIAKVTSDTATHTVTSFSLFLLLLFFLQTRPLPILPSLCQIAEMKNKEKNNKVAVNNLRSATCNQGTGDLLIEFFGFLRSFDFRKNGISPYHGKIIKKFENNPLLIENPLDKKLNVTLNVTKNSLNNLICAARVAQNHLEVLSKNTEIRNSQFWKTLSP